VSLPTLRWCRSIPPELARTFERLVRRKHPGEDRPGPLSPEFSAWQQSWCRPQRLRESPARSALVSERRVEWVTSLERRILKVAVKAREAGLHSVRPVEGGS
jgi:hypothetical protein